MLNIFFGDMPEAIYNTEVYFIKVYGDVHCDSEKQRVCGQFLDLI